MTMEQKQERIIEALRCPVCKAGMRHEGTLRQRIYNKGRYADVDLYAIVRSDFLGKT